jgi:hypothetical protein
VLVNHAAPLAQVSAGSICAPLEHQFAVVVPFRQQVGKVAPIALFVDRDACIVATGGAAGAGDRTSIATPPSPEKVACGAVYRALGLIQYSNLPYDRPPEARRGRTHVDRRCLGSQPFPTTATRITQAPLTQALADGRPSELGRLDRCPAVGGPSGAGDPLRAGYRPAASPPAVAAAQVAPEPKA